jgi:hypothetical protein
LAGNNAQGIFRLHAKVESFELKCGRPGVFQKISDVAIDPLHF